MLRALIRHLFLYAVIFGLAGQDVASASTPCHEMAPTQASAMTDMPDCAGMRDVPSGKVPCKDMSLGCFAMAGCSAVVALDAQPFVARSLSRPVMATWPTTSMLIGRDTAPEPDPPSLFD